MVNMDRKEIRCDWMNITLLFFSALAKCSVPSVSILFPERCNTANVCVNNNY
jgi:hypothetical protein